MTKQEIKDAIKEMIFNGELGFELHSCRNAYTENTEIELRVLVDDSIVYASSVYVKEA
jgi:hypothetical protein